MRAAVAQGRTVRGLEFAGSDDGSVLQCCVYASPLQDERGQIVGNIAALVDVTDRFGSRSGRLSHNLLSCVFDSTPTSSSSKDLSSRVLMINSAGTPAGSASARTRS